MYICLSMNSPILVYRTVKISYHFNPSYNNGLHTQVAEHSQVENDTLHQKLN